MQLFCLMWCLMKEKGPFGRMGRQTLAQKFSHWVYRNPPPWFIKTDPIIFMKHPNSSSNDWTSPLFKKKNKTNYCMLRALAEYNTSIVHQMNFQCTTWAVQRVYITNLIEQASTWIDVTDATTLELEATSIPVRWETYSCATLLFMLDSSGDPTKKSCIYN